MKTTVLLTQKTTSPVTIQVKNLRWLIVGGGHEAFGLLKLLYRGNNVVTVNLVSEDVEDAIKRFSERHPSFQWNERKFELNDLTDHHMIIIATGNKILDEKIHAEVKQENVLVYLPANPLLSDFALSNDEVPAPKDHQNWCWPLC